jgi:hypothetical protein
MSAAAPEVTEDTWIQAGDVAAATLIDIANKAKDAHDEAIDAKRVNNGMTLDEYLKKA